MKANQRHELDIEKIERLIDGIKTAMLTTEGEDGRLRSRPMATQPIDPRGSLWFFTNAHTAKIDEVRAHHQVNVSYCDPNDHRYVSISGSARIVREREKIEKLWKPAYATWLPKGRDDPDLALLEVRIEEAEYWDAPLSTMVVLFEFARGLLTGRPYEGGDHEKLDLQSEG